VATIAGKQDSMEGFWFSDATPRRMKIRSATSLVGKEPTKQKRIKLMCTMYLTGGGEDQITNLPDWLGEARDYVTKSGEQVTAAHAIKQVNVTMGDANLFKTKAVEAPKTQLDHFVIKQMGKGDDLDTVLTFEMRTQFSTDVWMWCGQQSGEEFDVVFDVIGQESVADGEDEEEADASEGEDDDDDDEDGAEGRELLADAKARLKFVPDPISEPSHAAIGKAKRNLEKM
jgi:hypothetical protein